MIEIVKNNNNKSNNEVLSNSSTEIRGQAQGFTKRKTNGMNWEKDAQ